jgi:hypothetical protein
MGAGQTVRVALTSLLAIACSCAPAFGQTKPDAGKGLKELQTHIEKSARASPATWPST